MANNVDIFQFESFLRTQRQDIVVYHRLTGESVILMVPHNLAFDFLCCRFSQPVLGLGILTSDPLAERSDFWIVEDTFSIEDDPKGREQCLFGFVGFIIVVYIGTKFLQLFLGYFIN